MKNSLLLATFFVANAASAATPVQGWYTNVFGGYTFLPNNVHTVFLNNFYHHNAFSSGYNVGGRLGYDSRPMRYEVEYTFLSAGLKQLTINYLEQTGVSGSSNANLFMANVYYDTPEMLPSISPYLGFGIGYAYIQQTLQSTGPIQLNYFSDSFGSFAYQGMVGLTYNFAENYAVNLGYRYVATSSSSNVFGSVYQVHMANAGATYRFDYGDYK